MSTTVVHMRRRWWHWLTRPLWAYRDRQAEKELVGSTVVMDGHVCEIIAYDGGTATVKGTFAGQDVSAHFEVQPMSIKPALTPEEWAERRVEENVPNENPHIVDAQYIVSAGWPTGGVSLSRGLSRDQGRMHHALAALCLHDWPFGFTREMVAALADMLALAEGAGSYIGHPDHPDTDAPRMKLALQAVANLRALLPPEDS